MLSQKLIFLCVAQRVKCPCLLRLFPSLSLHFRLFLSVSPAAQFIVAVLGSCDHLRPREAGGEEARGGKRELVSALGAGPTAELCVSVYV